MALRCPSNFENNDDEDHAVEVSIRIPTIHRICNNDLHNLDETFAVMRSTFIQKFIVVSDELKQTGEYVQFEILTSHLFMLYRETLISYISLMRNMEFREPSYAYETRMEKLGELIF